MSVVVVFSVVSSSICCTTAAAALWISATQHFPHTRSWTLPSTSSKNSPLSTREQLQIHNHHRNHRRRRRSLSTVAVEAVAADDEVIHPRLGRRRHHHQNHHPGDHHPSSRPHHYQRQHRQRHPAMYVRSNKILIFPRDGFFHDNDNDNNSMSNDIWSSIIETLPLKQSRNAMNKNDCEDSNDEKRQQRRLSMLPSSSSPRSSSSELTHHLQEIEVSCLWVTRALSNAIQRFILDDGDRHNGITTLKFRSCHLTDPTVLVDILDHRHLQRHLTHLEIHKMSGSGLTPKCMDSISNLLQLKELTLNIDEDFLDSNNNYHSTTPATTTATTEILNEWCDSQSTLVCLFQRLHKLSNLKVLRLNGCRLENSSFTTIGTNRHGIGDVREYSINSTRNSKVSPVQALTDHFRETTKRVERSSGGPTCCSSLKHLHLKCCQLSDGSVADLILAMNHGLPNLETLDLVGNNCCQNVFHVLGRVFADRYRRRDGEDLMDSASTIPTDRHCSFTVVDLSHQACDLSACDFSYFLTSLRYNETLRTLRLAGNYLDETSVLVLARSLAENKTLHHLDLSGTNLTETGSRAIIKAMRSNETLRHLNIKYNPQILDLSAWVSLVRSDNQTLHQFEHSIRSPLNGQGREQHLRERADLSHYLYLNRAGRSLLRTDGVQNTDCKAPATSLWPMILKRSMTDVKGHANGADGDCWSRHISSSFDGDGNRMDAVFFFLRYGPLIFQPHGSPQIA